MGLEKSLCLMEEQLFLGIVLGFFSGVYLFTLGTRTWVSFDLSFFVHSAFLFSIGLSILIPQSKKNTNGPTNRKPQLPENFRLQNTRINNKQQLDLSQVENTLGIPRMPLHLTKAGDPGPKALVT